MHKDGPASIYIYVYTLLHTYTHIVMKAVAEHSGLDLGSLGEYIFPADLAFVVYRNGTTMDLGNLSSLWRNVERSISLSTFSSLGRSSAAQAASAVKRAAGRARTAS